MNPGTRHVIEEVIATHEDEIGTHYDKCWKYHAGCLAVFIRHLEGDG